MQRVSTKFQSAMSLPIIPSDHYAQTRLCVTLTADNHSSTTPQSVYLPSHGPENPDTLCPKTLAQEPYRDLQSP
jgi:hypothetical protein